MIGLFTQTLTYDVQRLILILTTSICYFRYYKDIDIDKLNGLDLWIFKIFLAISLTNQLYINIKEKAWHGNP